jgi:phosphonate transport system substrate-binding protein
VFAGSRCSFAAVSPEPGEAFNGTDYQGFGRFPGGLMWINTSLQQDTQYGSFIGSVMAHRNNRPTTVDHPRRKVRMRTNLQVILALVVAMLATLVTLDYARATDVLNMGLVPSEDPRVILNDNKVLLEKLEKSLQMKIKPFIATDYNGVIEALRSKRLDIALLGPFSYALATSVANVEAFALLDTQGQGATYHSIIIARPDHGIRSLDDLSGKTFAFVDPGSTSGFLFPKAGLIKAGYNPDTYFSRVIFSGGHDASAIAVQNGKVDAAAIADALLETAYSRGMIKKGDVSVIWTSEPIPGPPIVYRRDLPEDLKAKIRAAFAQIHDVPWGPKSTIKQWVPAKDSDYDVIRETAKLLNLDLKSMQ